ncbi:M18 family aminopeptidase [Arthrobacter sp. UM1]|uniref:M18 family aminopeptidase n=1 Tax=Arthrobacter sp. UM1 TaxID=2766776 RepID=UPI001CF618F6|nr:M18 family aminopeptidase [Arthrobacter sp. UM1]MCB4208602.1 M18 family aminopeptidase [Arthrobacter sp. UM1]
MSQSSEAGLSQKRSSGQSGGPSRDLTSEGLSPEQRHALDLGDFAADSPSSFHAAAAAAERLEAAGFERLREEDAWELTPGPKLVVRDGALIAWIQPEGGAEAFDILGAHTDSPGFKLKPQSTTGSANVLQAAVEVYGGPLLNSWLDRELRLAGRLVLRDGSEHLVATEPLFRIPQLAIHLDRGVNAEGVRLDRQQHTQPVWGLGAADDADLLGLLAERADVDPAEVGGYDLTFADGQRPRLFGVSEELLASGRLDNLSSVHAGVVALAAAAEEGSRGGARVGRVPMLAAFDHEEVGSSTRSGAGGPFLEDVLVRIIGERGPEFSRATARSWHLSSDAGHAVHPNYPGHHDPAVRPLLGRGPLLKINADQRYATDAQGAAKVADLAQKAGVSYQEFVSNNTIPCGSTIGPITATRLGIRTVDVGVPLLSMHSAREMAAVDDLWQLLHMVKEFFRRPLS